MYLISYFSTFILFYFVWKCYELSNFVFNGGSKINVKFLFA